MNKRPGTVPMSSASTSLLFLLFQRLTSPLFGLLLLFVALTSVSLPSATAASTVSANNLRNIEDENSK